MFFTEKVGVLSLTKFGLGNILGAFFPPKHLVTLFALEVRVNFISANERRSPKTRI
jgi:hypothetical protein